jgi:hypothetical protein
MTTAARTPYALHWWRIGIRIPATLFVAIALILSIVVGSNCHNRDGFDDYLDCYPWLTFPFIILALVWDAAEYITLCVNKKGIHPGAHIALNFIVFAGLISGGPIDIIVGLDEYDYSHPALGGEGVLAVLAAYDRVRFPSFPCQDADHYFAASSTSYSSSSPASRCTSGGVHDIRRT